MHRPNCFSESASDAWRLRFGSKPPNELPDLGAMLNHRSVRDYSDEPIPEETMAGLIAAAQSASTSSNLQLWSVISVQDPERRERIAQLCDDQRQVRNAAWFLAFIVDHARLRAVANAVGESAEGLDWTEFFVMSVVDAALAAERLVVAAESLGIGVCYIGALRNDVRAVQEFFGLPEGTFGVFGLSLGWPSEPCTAEIKPRLAQSDVWFRETYPTEFSSAEYDARMRAFYESQKMKGDVTWAMRSGRRVDGSERTLTGRGALKHWLIEQGFMRR